MNRKSWIVVAVVAVVIGVVGFVLGARSQTSNSASEPEVSNWLFSQTADAGSIAPNGDDTDGP